MYKHFLTFSILLASVLTLNISSLFAQTEEVDFTITLHLFDADTKEDLINRSVQIIEDGIPKKKMIKSIDGGLAKFFLKPDKEYKIRMIPQDGYVEKLIIFDTRNIDLQHWKHRATPQVSLKYDVDVRLFKITEGACQDFSFLKDEPVMWMKYDSEYDDIHDFATELLEKRIKDERKKKCNPTIKEVKATF